MRKTILLAVAVVALVVTPMLAQRGGAGVGSNRDGGGQQAGVQFQNDLRNAVRQARRENKKLFVVFSTSWCGPCKTLSERVWSQGSFAEALNKVAVPVYLDGDVKKDEVARFNVKGYPTVLLVEADNSGTEIARQVGTGGMLTPEAWIGWLNQHVKVEGADKDAKDEAKKDDGPGVKFLTDLDAAKDQAKKEKKKLFIVFSTSWCGPCKVLDREVWKKSEFAESLAKVAIPVYMDGDVKRDEVQSFGVRGYPTVILAEADGTEIARQVGARMQTPDAWTSWINDSVKGGGNAPSR